MTFLDDDQYRREDARIFSIPREKKLIEDYLKDTSNPFHADNGWRESSVKIPLPKENVKWPSETAAPQLEIKGVHHRSLTNVITSVFEDSASSTFHMTPFQQMWNTSDGRNIQIFSEAYSSAAMLEAYAEVNSLPAEPDDNLERVVASLMMWSDSTHLANFGDASLWPFYLYFGNQSKYTRGKPTASACHHVAYIPTVCCILRCLPMTLICYMQLPDDFQDTYKKFFGEASTSDVQTHCKRELMHAIWELLLDEEFMHAYEHGIVIRCGDGVTRRIFPRFFSYSADYPEKYDGYLCRNTVLHTFFYQNSSGEHQIPWAMPMSSESMSRQEG
jgi:hypothetical protein